MPDQPLPQPPEGDVVLLDLLALAAERGQRGLNSYGQLLRTGNGRDDERDLVEELFDALMYALVLRRKAQAQVGVDPKHLLTALEAYDIIIDSNNETTFFLTRAREARDAIAAALQAQGIAC